MIRLFWLPLDRPEYVDVEDQFRQRQIREAERMAVLNEVSQVGRISGKVRPSDGIPIKAIVEKVGRRGE